MNRRDDLVFSMGEFDRRLQAVREQIEVRGLDALIVTTPENIFYLSGYHTPGYFYFQALVVPVEGEPFMVVRFLEASNVETRTWLERCRSYSDTDAPLATMRYALQEFGLGSARLGYEKTSYFFRAPEQEMLFAAARDSEFVDCSGLVETIRLVKSDEEIAVMRQAARAATAGMHAGIGAVEAGSNENLVAAAILQAMTAAGSQRPAMGPFVASGWRGAVGHAEYERRVIQRGENVFVEVGACVHNYHTAMMRPVFVGEPTPDVVEAERLIKQAMQRTRELISPGVTAGGVDAVAREVLERYTHDGVQGTRTGYSIGIGIAPYWGEGHTLSMQAGERMPLRENMTFHLIPWLQVPGRFGMGLSETIRVTADGCESFFDVESRLTVK